MSNGELIRAWKDPEFRATLEGAVVDHPAGDIELTDPGLETAGDKPGFASGTWFGRLSICACNTHGHCR